MPSSKIFVSVLLRKLDQVDEFDEIHRQNGRGKGKNASDFRSLLAYSHLDFVYKDFAVLYDGTEKELNEIVSAYGLVIQAFAENTKGYREPVSKESIIRNVDEARNRWRWAGKK